MKWQDKNSIGFHLINSPVMNNTFELRNLKCKYPSNDLPILEIDSLDIEEGSSTFFIGPSGVGKSTILETLGLMNNTVYQEDRNNTVFNFATSSTPKINMLSLWQKKEGIISDFRNKHLSFIFQNTNLFSTLSAYDNISITAILQGKDKKESRKRTQQVVSKILDDVTQDKPINELSGGQRQRIAFARAIVSDFSVLFADEPTGNLDMGNANRLMETLKNETKNRTTIIVTHDINLTLKYATKIVLIDRVKREDSDTLYGSINSETIFSKDELNNKWVNSKDTYSSESLFELLQHKLYQNLA